jgi:hypothetical protein
MIAPRLLAWLLATAVTCAGCGHSTRSATASAEPPRGPACERPHGALLERIRTIANTPTVWATLRLAPGQDLEESAAIVGARLAQIGGDLLGHEVRDGLLRVHIRLPHASAPRFAGLLARGNFGVHPVEDAAVHAMAEVIRARLVTAPEVRLERWQDGPAELAADTRDALVQFASALPIPPGTGWVLMGSPHDAPPHSDHRALLVGAARFTAADLDPCAVVADTQQTVVPELVLTFREASLPAFKAFTEAQVGRRVAFVFDDAVYTAPTVQEPIPGPSLRFSGNAGGDVSTLVALIRGGPLGAEVELVDFVFDLREPAGSAGDDVRDPAPE